MLDKSKLAVVHIAKKELNLSEENYRDILSGFDVESSKNLTEKQFFELMKVFKEQFGYGKAVEAPNPLLYNNPSGRHRKFASKGQLDIICVIWQRYVDFSEDWETQLDNFLFKRFGVEGRLILTSAKAITVTEAVKEMYLRKCLVTVARFHLPDDELFVENELLRKYKYLINNHIKEELAVIIVGNDLVLSGFDLVEDTKEGLDKMDFRKLVETFKSKGAK